VYVPAIVNVFEDWKAPPLILYSNGAVPPVAAIDKLVKLCPVPIAAIAEGTVIVTFIL